MHIVKGNVILQNFPIALKMLTLYACIKTTIILSIWALIRGQCRVFPFHKNVVTKGLMGNVDNEFELSLNYVRQPNLEITYLMQMCPFYVSN